MKKVLNNIYLVFVSIFTTLAFLVPAKIFWQPKLSSLRENLINISIFVFFVFIVIMYKRYQNIKIKFPFKVLSIIFSLLMIFGYSYYIKETAILVWGNSYLIIFSIIKLFGLYKFFKLVLSLIYEYFFNKKEKTLKKKDSKLINLFEKHPFLFSFVVILICYLPYIIAFYPGLLNPDAVNQIKEIMGIENRYMMSVTLIDPSVIITNFNPVLHTMILGNLFKLGVNIGNVNFGLFLYTIIQVVIVISSFAYSICYLKKNNIKNKFLFIILAIISLVPLFPLYAITGVKDVIFSSMVLLFVIKSYDFIKNTGNINEYIKYFIIIILVILFRNNGILIVFGSLLLMTIFLKGKRKPLFFLLLITLTFNFSYSKLLLPALKITGTSIREVLSVPFQQTARYVKYYENDLSSEDAKIIDKILDIKTLSKRYNPAISDPVKNEYNKNTTSEDLKNYLGVWWRGFKEHPGVYADATINNMYGYFYPNVTKWYVYTEHNATLNKNNFDYHFNGLSGIRGFLRGFAISFPYIPGVGEFANIGFITWMCLFLMTSLIVKKRKELILTLIPLFLVILSCVLGPVNTYFRYVLPIAYTLPFLYFLLKQEMLKD